MKQFGVAEFAEVVQVYPLKASDIFLRDYLKDKK
jgi:hypothetical protein